MVKSARRLLIELAATFPVAYLAGGFVFGVVNAEDVHGLMAQTLGRLLVGIVECINSAMTGGFPYADGTGRRDNAWPYIIGCWIAFFLATELIVKLYVRNFRDNRHP